MVTFKKISAAVCSLLLLTFTVYLWAAESNLAKITIVLGRVEVKNSGGWQPLKPGASVGQGSTLRTGKKSTVIVQLSPGTSLKLRENSEIILSQISASSDVKNIELSLTRGSVFSDVLKRNNNSRYLIKTAAVTAGVRGTNFFVATGEKIRQDKDPEVMMCVREGQIYVTSASDKREVIIDEGEGIVFTPQSKIPSPEKLPWIANLNWNMDSGKGNVEDSTFLKKAYRSSYKDKLNQNYD
ncbi:MAG: FecR domain-containing protein [Leptospiraceae bacterium]|nr:FecR domain-containing protein [Leptospiraceae bacterium]